MERQAAGRLRCDLLVSVVWADLSPASGVQLFLRETPIGTDGRDVATITTDASGTAVFGDLRPGRHQLLSDREDRQTLDLIAGHQQVTFTLDAGVHVVGTVRDARGRPVADAGIWLQTARTTWDAGREVARSDSGGTFELRHMNPRRSLGAFAKGHGPSPLVDLEELDIKTAPVRVELVLGPLGGDLAGVVRDTKGQPVAGAVVAAGRAVRVLERRSTQIVEAWTPRTTVTDTDGAFILAGLTTGELPVAVRRPGFAVWRGTATIKAGATTSLEVVLLPSATVYGQVVNAHGIPEARAVISAYDRVSGTSFLAVGQIDCDEVFGHVETAADDEGRFELCGVSVGEIHAFARRRLPLDDQGKPRRPSGVSLAWVRELLYLDPGERHSWNPVVNDGNRIAGVVLYRDGQPLGDVFLTLKDEQGEAEHIMTNAGNGQFEFLCLPESTFTLRVQYRDAPEGTPQLERSGLRPNSGLVELRAPFDKPVDPAAGRILGRIDDAGLRIRQLAEAQVELHSDKRSLRTGIVDGAYVFDRVDPCRFRIVLLERNIMLAESDWLEVRPAGVVDAGVLRTVPAGSIQIVLERGAGCEAVRPKLYLRRRGDIRSSTVEPGLDHQTLVDNLTPGDYEIMGNGAGICLLECKAMVRAGEVTMVSMKMQAGTMCRFEVWLPEGTTATTASYRIVDPDGVEFARREAQLTGMPLRPYPVWESVPSGEWRLLFDLDGGRGGEVAFTVRGSTEVKARLDVK